MLSRENVKIDFTFDGLNTRHAYLQAHSSGKDYETHGANFGLENIGKKSLIRRAIYSEKVAGIDFKSHIRSDVSLLKLKLWLADSDV